MLHYISMGLIYSSKFFELARISVVINGVLILMWATKNQEKWHALFVPTGQEEYIKETLEKVLENQLEFMIPKRILKERKAGKWHKVKRNLFPGYILVKGNITTETYYKIKNTPVAAKLLKNEEGPQEIEQSELEVLNILIENEDGDIGISKAYRENEKVIITSGPLAGLEGNIQSIDKRKGRAKVKIDFLGETRTVQLGIDFIDKV